MKYLISSAVLSLTVFSTNAKADFVILNDLITDGSACIGFDCVDGESFGFDTLRLKENNLRIKFEDTSTFSSFPGNDWQLTANDTFNGGANRFSVTDVTNDRVPFTIEAFAPSDSLRIDNGGRIGFGTSNPAVELHTVDGDTPTLRLEQDGSSGFAEQTWDVAGNEFNFFIRDTTAGELPLRIRNNNTTDTLTLANSNVGIGISNPSEDLHIRRSDGTTKFLLEEVSNLEAARTLFEIKNNGNTKFSITNTADATEWSLANSGTGFRMSLQNSGDVEFDLTNAGNLIIPGILSEGSDKNTKTNIVPVDPQSVLKQVRGLSINEWEYKDTRGERHISPMAQDFYATFKLGSSDQLIATLDTSGVALAAIQALDQENQTLKASYKKLQTAYHQQRQQHAEQLAAMEIRLSKKLKAELSSQQEMLAELQDMLNDQLRQQSANLVITDIE